MLGSGCSLVKRKTKLLAAQSMAAAIGKWSWIFANSMSLPLGFFEPFVGLFAQELALF